MFIVINHLSEASFKPLCAHFHTVQRLIENTSAFKNKYSMFQKMVSYNIKYMYSVANGQTHTHAQKQRKKDTVLLAALLILLCPACVIIVNSSIH